MKFLDRHIPTFFKTGPVWLRWFKALAALGLAGGLAGIVLIAGVLFYFAGQVPDFRTLADYQPSQITKIYDRNGKIIAEYAKERRIYVPYEKVPQPVIEAFLAAEDASFFEHGGFNVKAIFRAFLVNVFTSKKQGASTITQQVAKTFLLSSERTYTRKIKELILAHRIESAFTKEEILELYLNQIYLGNGAYGILAAAQAYYDKSLENLTIGQRAMLAGLPKAPSAYNPVRYPRVARLRRDVIIRRMEAENFITPEEATAAIAEDLNINITRLKNGGVAPHFAEHVRRYLEEVYGAKKLYHAGLQVYTTLDLNMQIEAEKAVTRGLREYTRRHGYRGPLGKVGILINWRNRIEDEEKELRQYSQFGFPAAVLEVQNDMARIGLPNGSEGLIPLDLVKWARAYIDADKRGPAIKKVGDVLEVGDIVLVQPLQNVQEFREGGYKSLRTHKEVAKFYSLEQIPLAQSSLVSLDVETGAVRAMVGGSDPGTGFNRAVQAKRQGGSSFKPLVYALALEKGYSPASIILDAPVVFFSNDLKGNWKPQNYSEKVYGPSTMRRGLEKSRNLMTIRLARKLGIRNITSFAQKAGIDSPMENNLSTSLGSGSYSLMEITNAYSVFPRGGSKVQPYYITHIQDAAGNVIESAHPTCTNCQEGFALPDAPPPPIAINKTQVMSEESAYQMTSMLQGTVQRGTGWRARAVGKPVGAKTGTTDDYKDAWFIGFSPTLATGVWFGFDKPETLGDKETGSKAASPIWTYYMTAALKNDPTPSFKIPPNISFVRIDRETGLLPNIGTKYTLLEAFKQGTEPKENTAKTPTAVDGETEELDLYGIY